MAKNKKWIAICALAAVTASLLTGCMGFGGGYGAPEPTKPPEKEFKSVEELKKVVADAKASETDADLENLKGLDCYYDIKTLPEGAKLNYIKVSSMAARVSYTFGPTKNDSYDNQIEIVWYRDSTGSTYLTDTAKKLIDYETLTANGQSYLVSKAIVSVEQTRAPGDTSKNTPEPKTQDFFQLVYWVQDDDGFLCTVPLGMSKEDIGKYCMGVKMDIK